MVQNVHVKLYVGFSIVKQYSAKRREFSWEIGLKFRGKNLVICYIWDIAFYLAGTRTFRKVDY